MDLMKFYNGKKVLITGHTGFKGTWMSKLLIMLGANVFGFSLKPETDPNLYDICSLSGKMHSIEGDIRDLQKLRKAFKDVNPEIVIHMAAQPLVCESYIKPVYTFETNVMGTVNVLECIRENTTVKSFVNVTTDKVYMNKEWEWGYREYEELNGFDPYSNSKSCSELVTSSYKKSFFGGENCIREDGSTIAISTCRAGNVIGGGDFAVDRIIPDCIRAAIRGEDILLRNPLSVRPYQHVLEPIVAYLLIAKEQYEDVRYAGCYNIGPNEENCWQTKRLVEQFCKEWRKQMGEDIHWSVKENSGPHEANFLKLDCSKMQSKFGWHPLWNVEVTMQKIVEWTKAYYIDKNPVSCMEKQIYEYLQSDF